MAVQPTIYLALVDDWELRGDGSGDVYRLQFRPMRKLVEIFNAHGIRGSFNAEVMQQITFRKLQAEHPELKTLADDWDSIVSETYRQGHDVQLHVHPQWRNAEYKNGNWRLTGDWSILNHSAEAAYQMIASCKEYLENLLRCINPTYRCISFRSGAWCIAPSPHILTLLAKLGIVFDMSMVGGLCYNNKRIQLDYTKCEEAFLPYYPVMTDARKVSDKPEEIICIPTNHFYQSRAALLKKQLKQVKQKIRTRSQDAGARQEIQNYYTDWAETLSIRGVYRKLLAPYLIGKHFISDIAQLDYSLLSEMLTSIRRRARESGLKEVPIILENHTKDIQDFSQIERFVEDVAKAPDIKCLTLNELADKLQKGRFPIRTANTPK